MPESIQLRVSSAGTGCVGRSPGWDCGPAASGPERSAAAWALGHQGGASRSRRLPVLSSTRTDGAEMQLLLMGERGPVSFSWWRQHMRRTARHSEDKPAQELHVGLAWEAQPRLSALTSRALAAPVLNPRNMWVSC